MVQLGKIKKNARAREDDMNETMCQLCGLRPATVPERDLGRLVRRLCRECGEVRRKKDVRRIIELIEQRKEREKVK